MKRRHRIEITAFRRRATFVEGVVTSPGNERPEGDNDGSLSNEVTASEIDAAGEECATIDVTNSPEVSALIEALVKSNGHGALAAQRLGLNRRSFYSKLHRFRLSLRQLRAKLKIL